MVAGCGSPLIPRARTRVNGKLSVSRFLSCCMSEIATVAFDQRGPTSTPRTADLSPRFLMQCNLKQPLTLHQFPIEGREWRGLAQGNQVGSIIRSNSAGGQPTGSDQKRDQVAAAQPRQEARHLGRCGDLASDCRRRHRIDDFPPAASARQSFAPSGRLRASGYGLYFPCLNEKSLCLAQTLHKVLLVPSVRPADQNSALLPMEYLELSSNLTPPRR